MPQAFKRIPAALIKHYLDTGEACAELDAALMRSLEALSNPNSSGEEPIEVFITDDEPEDEE